MTFDSVRTSLCWPRRRQLNDILLMRHGRLDELNMVWKGTAGFGFDWNSAVFQIFRSIMSARDIMLS